MEKATLKVDGMSCQHCVMSVQKSVGGLAGVGDVAVDLAAKTVTVTFDPNQSALDKIKTEIEDQGFAVVG
jgi:copper chaperone